MESFSDLSGLLETTTWRYPPFNPLVDNIEREHDASHSLRARYVGYRRKLHSYHHLQIHDLRSKLEALSTQHSYFPAGTTEYLRETKQIESRRSKIRHQLHRLETGWHSISATLYADSITLFSLPREIRDQIYAYIYLQHWTTADAPLRISHPGIEACGRPGFMAWDETCYCNASVVHPRIAAEAAQATYEGKWFHVDYAAPQDHLQQFLSTAHFNSGLAPMDINVTRLHLSLWIPCIIPARSHEHFEDVQRTRRSCGGSYDPDRKTMSALLAMRGLRVLDLRLWNLVDGAGFDSRGIGPMLISLAEKGVKINVTVGVSGKMRPRHKGWEREGKVMDISERFVPRGKSLDDANCGRVLDGTGKRDVTSGHEWPDEEPPNSVRWMRNHYEAFLAKELEEKMRVLRKAKRNIDALNAMISSSIIQPL